MMLFADSGAAVARRETVLGVRLRFVRMLPVFGLQTPGNLQSWARRIGLVLGHPGAGFALCRGDLDIRHHLGDFAAHRAAGDLSYPGQGRNSCAVPQSPNLFL